MHNQPQDLVPPRPKWCRLQTVIFLCLLLSPLPSQAQELRRGGIDIPECPSKWSLEASVGVTSLDLDEGLFDTERVTLSLTPRFTLYQSDTQLLQLALPLRWIPGNYPAGLHSAGWQSGDGQPCSSPGCDRFFPLEEEDREAGPTIVLAPGLEWTFQTDCCWQPSVFVGAGLWHEREQTLVRPRFLDATGRSPITQDTTSPLATFGAALRRPLSPRVALRFEARVSTVWHQDTELWIEGPLDGAGMPSYKSGISLDRGERTSLLLSLGFQFDL